MLAICFAISSAGPTALGWAKSTIGLTQGIALLAPVLAVSGAIIFLAIRFSFTRDYYDESAAIRSQSEPDDLPGESG